MASVDADVDVSHLSALKRAARKQMQVTHHARAVELYERALAAAEALGQPDCLIVASLRQMLLAERWKMTFAVRSGEDDASKYAAALAKLALALEAHLPAVLETLERRRAQGTLRAGRCRAHEVAWSAGYLQAEARARSTDEVVFGAAVQRDFDDVRVSLQALYIGVATYFAAAHTNINTWILFAAQNGPQHASLPALCLTFIKHALQFALQAESLIHSDQTTEVLTSEEYFFLDSFRTILLPRLQPEAPLCAGVLAAWRNLERNGPLLHKLLDEEMRAGIKSFDAACADAQAAKDARKPLRACALPACGAREAHAAHFKKCGACGGVVYCSKAHQAEHWPAHKAACKAARKAAAKAHDGQAAGEGGASQQQDDT